jgi:hypothetical protein
MAVVMRLLRGEAVDAISREVSAAAFPSFTGADGFEAVDYIYKRLKLGRLLT